MKVAIDNCCTGCGLCIESCPDVFTACGAKAAAVSGDIPAECEMEAQRAACDCPLEAICIE